MPWKKPVAVDLHSTRNLGNWLFTSTMSTPMLQDADFLPTAGCPTTGEIIKKTYLKVLKKL
jgi:hypothetical protein